MRAGSIFCSGCGGEAIGRRWRGAFRSLRGSARLKPRNRMDLGPWRRLWPQKAAARPPHSKLLGVVEDDTEGVTRAAMNAADSVAEIHAVVAARAFYGAIARCENYCLALVGRTNFSLGLRTGLLLD